MKLEKRKEFFLFRLLNTEQVCYCFRHHHVFGADLLSSHNPWAVSRSPVCKICFAVTFIISMCNRLRTSSFLLERKSFTCIQADIQEERQEWVSLCIANQTKFILSNKKEEEE